MLNIAPALNTLQIPPANRPEKPAGDRVGQDSIRLNDRWRISFAWRDGDAYGSEIVDCREESAILKGERRHPVHPGEVLLGEFLKPIHLSQNRLALDVGAHLRRTSRHI
jgi:hypothetical protein